jgi:Phage tail tube protein
MPIKKLTGDLAQTSVGSNITFTATTASGSPGLTAVSSTTGLVIGQVISGTGIPLNTTISAIPSGSTITMSANATASGSATVVAAAEQQVLGLSEWSIDWKRKTVEATTTDDSAYESSLPSSKSWTVKAKYIFYDGDASQNAQIMAAISNPAGAVQWNFFPDYATSDVVYTGLAYVDGITIAAGVGKVIGLDVSLKGTGPLTVGTQAAPISNPNTITGEQAEV